MGTLWSHSLDIRALTPDLCVASDVCCDVCWRVMSMRKVHEAGADSPDRTRGVTCHRQVPLTPLHEIHRRESGVQPSPTIARNMMPHSCGRCGSLVRVNNGWTSLLMRFMRPNGEVAFRILYSQVTEMRALHARAK